MLAVRYRSLTLPFIANPRIHLSGMVGGSKAEIFKQLAHAESDAVLPWFLYTKTHADIGQQALMIITQVRSMGFDFPIVCKPDTGCRGAGVKRVQNHAQLREAIQHYPASSGMIVQKLARHSNEAGIFYLRYPNQLSGQIVSLAFKETPVIRGDGVSTLEELVHKDHRASRLQHLHASRNREHWKQVLPKGKHHSLLFSASHCRGATFRDGRAQITPQLTTAIDRIMHALPDFHYGRLDVKFSSLQELEAGESLEIVEINGASSEAIHIWDKDARFSDAIRTLLWQYRTLFQLGDHMRKQGFSPPPVKQAIGAWRHERRLTSCYPETD